MTHSKHTQWVYDSYVPKCVFVNGNDKPDGKPAVGVYVSADDHCELRPFCLDHAKAAEGGDGPSYWLIPMEKQCP